MTASSHSRGKGIFFNPAVGIQYIAYILHHRVRKLNEPIPSRIAEESKERVKEIKELLATIETDVQGINRYRYSLSCLEEFVEAVSFAHYLEHQTLISPEQVAATLEAQIPFTAADYVYGVFDLTGEMMRFATAVTALMGAIPGNDEGRTILTDMQDTASMLLIVPPLGGKTYSKKVDVMVEQVLKVERVGYGIVVRGNERPKGWMPDMNDTAAGGRDEREGSPI